MLIENGADINTRSNDGQTPTHIAAFRGHIEVLRLLIENGADVNARSNRGQTPLQAARQYYHAACVELLVAANATDDDDG